MEKLTPKDGDENIDKEGLNKKSKKSKRRYEAEKEDEKEDGNVLNYESETPKTPKKKHKTSRKSEEEHSSELVHKHSKKKKHKKEKKEKYASDYKIEEKIRNKSKILVMDNSGDIMQDKDSSKKHEEITIMEERRNEKNGKGSMEKKKHQKKKKSSTNVDSDRGVGEMKCEEVDISKSKDKQTFDAGQWGSASFDSVEQKNKFIRLLGGFKNKTHETSTDSVSHGLKKFNSAAMNKDEEEKLNKKLETQYQQAFDTSRKRRGFGLGYDSSHDTNMKDFHIDVEQPSKSIKFE